MKTQTAINRILNSDISDELKISKLQTLSLKTFPGSPNQLLVIAERKKLQEKLRNGK